MPGSVRPQRRSRLVHVDCGCHIRDVNGAILLVKAHAALKNIEYAHAQMNVSQLRVLLAAVMQLFDITRSKRDRPFPLASTNPY